MKLIPENHKPEKAITVTMQWDECEGDMYPSIYYDHICVAYISDTDGSICPLDLETGPFNGGDQQEYVDYLKERGVKLTVVMTREGPNGRYITYQVSTR